MFKESFKYYKAKWPVPDFAEVVDFDSHPLPATVCEKEISDARRSCSVDILPGLNPVSTWRCYCMPQKAPGLIIIRNPFTVEGQRYWIARCLRDYPRHPNKVNLNANLFAPSVLEDWWRELLQCNDKDETRRMKVSMRWATLGYHHDWDTKVYSEKLRGNFPSDLALLCRCFANVLDFSNFNAQAAIVNFYPLGTTLAGHTDHSEQNLEAPLFSISFGQTAIFLIGGKSKEEKPIALYLKSGDVLVMSGESRLCYHAVPRVMKAHSEPWNERIRDADEQQSAHCHKKLRTEDAQVLSGAGCIDMQLYRQAADEQYWEPFKTYLTDARINVNVRQVLHADAESLPDAKPPI